MFMDSIRRGAKKHRTVMLIVVIILCLGLVAGFAIGGGLSGGTQPTLAEQIAAYESVIASTREDLAKKPNDYSLLTQLADYLLTVTDYYNQNNEPDKAVLAAADAITNLDAAIANAPEGLNDKGQALLLAKKASAQNICNNMEEADALFKQAMATAPDFWTVEAVYLNFIWQREGIGKALEYAKTRTSAYAEGTNERTQLNSYIDLFEQLEALLNQATVNQDSTAPSSAPTSAPAQ